MSKGDHPTRKLTRTDFDGPPAERMRVGAPHKADLLVYEIDGERVVLKDYAAKQGIWRDGLGVAFTRRESRALKALRNVEGVPQFRGRPDRHSVAMTLLNAEPLRKRDPRVGGNEAFVRDLVRIVRQMHERGVVHLDLKHRTNVMVSSAGRPVVIDFESAFTFDPDTWGGRLAVRLLGTVDRIALQKWKLRLCPQMLSAQQMRRAMLMRRLSGWFLPRRLVDFLLALAERGARSPDEP